MLSFAAGLVSLVSSSSLFDVDLLLLLCAAVSFMVLIRFMNCAIISGVVGAVCVAVPAAATSVGAVTRAGKSCLNRLSFHLSARCVGGVKKLFSDCLMLISVDFELTTNTLRNEVSSEAMA